MTLTSLGFGGVTGTPSSYTGLSTLVREFAPDRFSATMKRVNTLLDSGAIEEIPANGAEHVVYLCVGRVHATAWVQDNALIPRGANIKPQKARAVPSNVISVMEIGHGASLAELGDDGLTDLFDATLDMIAQDQATHFARGLHGGAVSPAATAAWSAEGANATVSLTFADISMFMPGMAVDYIDTSTTKSYVVRVADVVPGTVGTSSANVAGTVSFINDVVDPATGGVIDISDSGAVTVATTDVFRLRGTTPGFGGSSTAITGNALTSYDDICGSGGAASLQGFSASTLAGWRGLTRTLSAGFTQEAMLGFASLVNQFSGYYPTHAIVGSQIAAAHMASSGIMGGGAAGTGIGFGLVTSNTVVPNRERSIDASMDKFGNPTEANLRMSGLQVIVDPNAPQTQITLHNRQKTKLVRWREMQPVMQAGDPIFVNQERFSLNAQFAGMYQLVTSHRSANATITGITGL